MALVAKSVRDIEEEAWGLAVAGKERLDCSMGEWLAEAIRQRVAREAEPRPEGPAHLAEPLEQPEPGRGGGLAELAAVMGAAASMFQAAGRPPPRRHLRMAAALLDAAAEAAGYRHPAPVAAPRVRDPRGRFLAGPAA